MTLAISNYIEKQRIAPPLTTSHYLLTTFVYSELCERSLDYRFAQVPNARLGHIHASMVATLALRICRLIVTNTLPRTFSGIPDLRAPSVFLPLPGTAS